MIKKVKNKKYMIAIVVLLFAVVVGTTYALFFSNTSLANLFSVGNFNVVTTETFTSPASWQPGQEISKTITATNNGNIQAAFRVKYSEAWVDSNNSPISNVPNDAVTINFINNYDWSYNSSDGYYYYNWIIEPGDTTRSLISGITLNSSLTGNASCVEDGNTYNCSSSISGLEGATYILTFTKETVIYSKYQSFWNTNQEIGEYQYLYTLPEGRTAYNLQVGDEVCINGDTTECFNFYGYDGNNIKLLSKWNLKVGKIYDSGGTQTGIYSSSDTGYGLQNSEAKGWVSGQTSYGTVAFSATNYWYSSGLKPKYGSSYPADVYDTDYKTEPDFSSNGFNTTGYSIAYYVEEYKKVLEDYGVTIADARLLTYSEATSSSIGCSGSNKNCPTNGFITNTSFWLGSANDDNCLWSVYSVGYFYNSGYYSIDYNRGVRPVIVLSKSEVNANVADANKYNPVSLPSGRTKDNLQVGDEVCINGDTTECFNFYGYDGNNVKLLSKWNLKVGKIYDSSNTETGTYSSSDTGYGLQSSEAKGYVDGQNRYGTVAFSATSYWGSSGLKPKYGSSYPADVYDTDYKTAPDFSSNGFLTTGYSIAYYVEEYKKVLEDYGVIVGDARLLTYSEATSSSIGCSESSSSCPDNGFIRNTSFWLGTARSTDYLWIVRSDGYFRDGRYYASNSYNRYGVRPVIVISKDAI